MIQGSIGTMLCYFAEGSARSYEALAKKELDGGGRIRFYLKPFGYNNEITHWHIVHKMSNKTWIVLA